MASSPLIVDIKRHSLEDGPGIRSVVFLKGCPLRCVFCQNPETWKKNQEIAFVSDDCDHCGDCVEACPTKAVDLNLPGGILRSRCNNCGLCVDVCAGRALKFVAKRYATDELLEILLRDASYYAAGEGGITFSGGECTVHYKFLQSLLEKLKSLNIHVAVQTSGFFDYDLVGAAILDFADIIYYDVKFAENSKHIRYTGRSNRRILDNLRRLLGFRADSVHVRVPLVPGITATPENLRAIAEMLVGMKCRRVSLLPYNPMGISKYESLGLQRPELQADFMDTKEEAEICDFFGVLVNKPRNGHTGPIQVFEDVSSC